MAFMRGPSILYCNLRPDLLDLALKFEYAEKSSYGGFRALSRWFYSQPWGSLTCKAGVNDAAETRCEPEANVCPNHSRPSVAPRMALQVCFKRLDLKFEAAAHLCNSDGLVVSEYV